MAKLKTAARAASKPRRQPPAVAINSVQAIADAVAAHLLRVGVGPTPTSTSSSSTTSSNDLAVAALSASSLGAGVPEPCSPVGTAQNRLDNAIDTVLMRCSNIGEKIAPVLRPEPPKEVAAGSKPDTDPVPSRSNLSDYLHTTAYRLERLAEHLDGVFGRIEL